MRIVKYLFLLLLLGFIGFFVFVATQKGDFVARQSTIINVPRSVLFNYVNDYKNWEDWSSWKEDDPNMTFVYPENTVGLGGQYSWSGKNGDGKITTVFVKENDSISQKVLYGTQQSNSYVSFKDTLGKTKMTWYSTGSLDFMAKVYATFTGGVDNMVNTMQERSLNNLNKVITKEINTFSVKVNGIVVKPATYYLKKTAKCKTSEMQARILSMLPKIIAFCKKNKIPTNGNPFVMYENIDAATNSVTFSVCMPLREELFFSPESDVSVGKLEAFSALKTTLTGDYSHRPEAKKQAVAYLTKNNTIENTAIKKIDVYVKSASDVKNPSKWVTELLMPLQSVATPAKPKAPALSAIEIEALRQATE